MTAQLEALVDSYYEDSIELYDGRFLCFKRLFDYRCTNRHAIEVSIEDIENQTITSISTYFDGRWVFSTPLHESMFWTYIKPNFDRVKAITTRMKEAGQSKDMFAYRIQLNKAAQSIASPISKLFEIFKGK
jgi:hypothetical protein